MRCGPADHTTFCCKDALLHAGFHTPMQGGRLSRGECSKQGRELFGLLESETLSREVSIVVDRGELVVLVEQSALVHEDDSNFVISKAWLLDFLEEIVRLGISDKVSDGLDGEFMAQNLSIALHPASNLQASKQATRSARGRNNRFVSSRKGPIDGILPVEGKARAHACRRHRRGRPPEMREYLGVGCLWRTAFSSSSRRAP